MVNSEVLWLEIEEALAENGVLELTKKWISSAVSEKKGLCDQLENSEDCVPCAEKEMGEGYGKSNQ